MCCRARRRSSWTSVRNGFSVINNSPSRFSLQESSPFGAEAGLARIISPAAPEEFAANSGQPHGAKKDPYPDRNHDRMQEKRAVQPIAERSKENQARNADDDDRGHAGPVAGEGEHVRQDVEDQSSGIDEKPEDVVATVDRECILGKAFDHLGQTVI